jgi:hypothetical protein
VSGDRDPHDVSACAVDASGKWVRACTPPTILNGPHPMEPARCLVFDVALADKQAAQSWGNCSPRSVCKAAALGGALHCYRDDGFDDR